MDASRSENASDILSRVNIQNDSDRADLESKLEAAEQIAIELRGNQVVLASSKVAPVNFTADGRDRSEQHFRRQNRSRSRDAARSGIDRFEPRRRNRLSRLHFASVENGKSLKVTRRITTGYLSQTVFAESFYNKTDSVAQLGIDTNNNSSSTSNNTSDNNSDVYSSSDSNDNSNSNYPNNYPTTTTPRTGNFIVPNGTILTGTFCKMKSRRKCRRITTVSGDRDAPNEYRGAVIEGYISGLIVRVKFPDARKSRLISSGFVCRTVRLTSLPDFCRALPTPTEKPLKSAPKAKQKATARRKKPSNAAASAPASAHIIGAIAGGAKGAAIGAIIGGGAGAGSVILTGKEELELKQGSSITVQASSPNR